ncbi:dUTP diphosphatase [Candidatus Woesearchaeota archaeon]|nr:dUTP diphosphatase [Candidatus Woesearchaeota archaeon]
MEIKIKKLDKDVELPRYTKKHDAALDIRSNEEGIIKSGETKTFATGLAFQIPQGHVGLIWDRSGLAAKNSIHSMAGVIDAGYRGEVKIVLKNLGNEDFAVEKGMRIAQMVIQPVLNTEVIEVEELEETERGATGFGSSGLK